MSARTATAGPGAEGAFREKERSRAGRAPGARPATRDRIVDAALRLFSERGTAAVSVRELADAADVTVPGLYYHFDSKTDLIREVYRAQGLGRSEDELEQPSATSLEARVVERARTEFAGLVENAAFLRHMQRESVLGDEDARQVGDVLRTQWRERWRLVLAGSDDVRDDADLDAAAEVIPTFLWGLFVEYLNRLDPSVIERVEPFARLIAPALTGVRS